MRTTNKIKKVLNSRQIIYLALLTAVAVVLSAVESMIPVPAPAPGFKLGLANTVTLIILMERRSPICALVVTIARCTLAALLTGAVPSLLFSLAGGIFSCMVMWLLLHFNYHFSVIGASVAGALSHNLGQLAAASALARDSAVFSYAPALMVAGVAAGCATGYIALRINNVIKIIGE